MDRQTDRQMDVCLYIELDSGFISLQLKIIHAMHYAHEERCHKFPTSYDDCCYIFWGKKLNNLYLNTSTFEMAMLM